MRAVLPCAAAAGLIAAGCALASSDSASGAFTRVDSAGIVIITNSGVTNRGDWGLDEAPVTVIGGKSSDKNQQFRRAPLATRLQNETVVTAEEGTISAFDRGGVHLKTLVRRGTGPDELESTSQMFLRGDTLMIRGSGKISQLDELITLAKLMAEMPVPDSMPAVAGLLMGARGELVVQHSGWRASDSLSLFDVFDTEGVLVAEWKLPRRSRIVEVGDDYVLYTRLDEDDIPLVEVLRYRRE